MEEPQETNFERNSPEINDEEVALSSEVSGQEANQFKLVKLGSCITIEPILFAIFISVGLTKLVTADLILSRTCTVHFKLNKTICYQLVHSNDSRTDDVETEVQPYSVTILTWMSFCTMLFSPIVSLFIGPWTDYNGRKLMIIIPAFGFFLQYVLFAVIFFNPNIGPEYGFLPIIPVMLSGGFVNFMSSVFSYTSDISTEDNRFFRMSMQEVVIFLGYYIGFLCSSYIYEAGGVYGYFLIYLLSAFIVLAVIIPTYFFVPESLQTTEEGKGLWHIFEFKLVKEMLKVCFKKRERYQRAVIFLVITSLMISISLSIDDSNLLFFFTKLRFKWSLQKFTFWKSEVLAIEFFGFILGIIIFTKWLKVSDAFLGMLGYGLKAASLLYIAFIPPNTPNLMFYSGCISIFVGLYDPVSRALLSKTVPKEDLGKVFAFTGSCESIFPLAIGPLYMVLYNATIKTLPSAFLFINSSVFILCSVFFLIIYMLQKADIQTEYERMENEIHNG